MTISSVWRKLGVSQQLLCQICCEANMQVLLHIKAKGFDEESSCLFPHVRSIIFSSASTKQPQDSNIQLQLLHKVIFTNIFSFVHDHL